MEYLPKEKLHFFSDKNFWVSFLITLGLYAFCFAFFTVRFEENDDLVLSLIAKGYFTGTPDHHLVYINSITGRFLAGLYSLNQNIPWYSLLLIFLQFISILGVFYGVLIKKVHHTLLVICLCFPFAYFIINLQFTSITILLAFSGILLFEVLQPKSKLGYLLPILLLLFSSLIRFEAFAFALLIGGFFILRKVIKEKRYISALVLIIVTGIPQIISALDYQDNEWMYFNEYVKLLSKTGDNPNTFGNKSLIVSNLNIPEENIDLLERYVLVQDFDKPTLNNIYNLTNSSGNVWKPISELRNFLRRYIVLEFCLFLLLVLSFIYNRWLIIPILMPNILLAFVILERTPKDRVVIGGILIAVVLSLINLPNLKREFVFVISLLVIGFFSIKIFTLKSDSPIDYSTLSKDRAYVAINPSNVFRGRETSPFDLDYMANYNVIIGGWLTNSPLMTEQLRRFGISAQPHISVIDNDEINNKSLYIDRNNVKAQELFNELKGYLDKRGKNITVESQNESIIIYKISSRAN